MKQALLQITILSRWTDPFELRKGDTGPSRALPLTRGCCIFYLSGSRALTVFLEFMLPATSEAVTNCFQIRRDQLLQRELELEKHLQSLPSHDARTLLTNFKALYTHPFLKKLDVFEASLKSRCNEGIAENPDALASALKTKPAAHQFLLGPEEREALAHRLTVQRSEFDSLVTELCTLRNETRQLTASLQAYRARHALLDAVNDVEERIKKSTTEFECSVDLWRDSKDSLMSSSTESVIDSVYKELEARGLALPRSTAESMDTVVAALEKRRRRDFTASVEPEPPELNLQSKDTQNSTRFISHFSKENENRHKSHTSEPHSPTLIVRPTHLSPQRRREKKYRGRSIILMREQPETSFKG